MCGAVAHQIRLHEFKHKIDIAVIVRLEHVRQRDNVLVSLHLLKEHDLAKGPLGVGRVLEGVKDLLESDHLLCPLVHCPPHDAVRALPKLLDYVVLSQNVPIDLFAHATGAPPLPVPAGGDSSSACADWVLVKPCQGS